MQTRNLQNIHKNLVLYICIYMHIFHICTRINLLIPLIQPFFKFWLYLEGAHRHRSSIDWFGSQRPTTARIPKGQPHFPCGWQWPSTKAITYCPTGCPLARNWIKSDEVRTWTSHSNIRYRCPKHHLNNDAKCLPLPGTFWSTLIHDKESDML